MKLKASAKTERARVNRPTARSQARTRTCILPILQLSQNHAF